MSDVLQRILAVKAGEVAQAKRATPLGALQGMARQAPPDRKSTRLNSSH